MSTVVEARRADTERNCEHCGAAFTARHPSDPERFCGVSCSAKAQPRGAVRLTGTDAPAYKDGRTLHPLYSTWHGMRYRCQVSTAHRYQNYGGRGITVCERWDQDFWAFVEDMGPRPDGYTLDRINNDGNYEPDNCRWATRSEQNSNQRPRKARS